MRNLNIRQRLLLGFLLAAFLTLILGGISAYAIRLLNNNLKQSSSELKTNVESELNYMQAQNAISDLANAILSANASKDAAGIDPTGTLNALDETVHASIDKSVEDNLAELYEAKSNYLSIREALDASMMDFMQKTDSLSELVGESVEAVRANTLTSATQKQEEISTKTDSTTRDTLAELSQTASSTLDDTVLVLQLRGMVLELDVSVDRYLRAPGAERASAISSILEKIAKGFENIPENVAGPFEVAAMDALRSQAEEILTGANGIVKQSSPNAQAIKDLEGVLAELDEKLIELADNTVFDGSNNLSTYLKQVTSDLGSSLGTLIQTQKDTNEALGVVSDLQQRTTSLKERLYSLLFMVQNASLKCTDECVRILSDTGDEIVSGIEEDKTAIVADLNLVGESDKAASIDAQLDEIIAKARGESGIIAQTIKAADAYNHSIRASQTINESLTESTRKTATSFREFTDRITDTMQEKVTEGGFWMKVQLGFVMFIFAVAIGLGFWIGATVAKRLGEAVIQLFGLSQKLSASAASLTESSEEQATMASEQAASLEESSSTVEEISSMAARNNDAVRDAAQISEDVLKATELGTDKMKAMSSTIDAMNNASTQIGKIIRAIDEIAFQTNILALNAAVEAARAGEAGAGFAVVADEVRSLALRSKNAAQETEQIIAHNHTLTQDSVKMCSSVADSLDTIKERINKLDTLVKEISHASQEQTMGLDQINQGLAMTSSATQKNAALAQQGASSAADLNREASNLIETIDDLSNLSGLSMGGHGSNTQMSIESGYDDDDTPPPPPQRQPQQRHVTIGGNHSSSGRFLSE
ncbi:MAG: hypothetical protein JW942_06755 [Opitutales bacterium]|nr:hypothetical protein [Opitutales bacterium]